MEGTPGSRSRFPPTRKSLGQHFLRDAGILSRIADAVQATSDDTVVEIGPGRGALTDHLLKTAGRVIAVEVDRALAAMLRERYADDPRVQVLEADILQTDLTGVAGPDFLLVGNVPYYITTPIIFQALERPRPKRAVYLVQREVADRLASPPGNRTYGALSVNVQAVAEVEWLFGVPSGAFAPPPKVESAVVRITPRAVPDVPAELEERFRAFVIDAFGARRKQMRRVLRTITGMSVEETNRVLQATGVPGEDRPEVLSAADFARLVRALSHGE
jgi:16S rRNA (adenine1518-N6/adenine1519-N6)-dimethyltransferase